MNQIKCQNSENGKKYSREFDLSKDFSIDELLWIIRIGRDFGHHDLRVGYTNGKSIELLKVHYESKGILEDPIGKIKMVGINKILEEGEMRDYGFSLLIPKGKKLYIEVNGICDKTIPEAEDLMDVYTEGFIKMQRE